MSPHLLVKHKLAAFAGYRGGIFDCDCACAAAPNYAPVAAASEQAAIISAELGREQLAEARRQYDLNRAVSDQVTNAQLGLMNQTKEQGDDYFNYMKSRQRPVEDELNRLSMQDLSARDTAERNDIQARYDQMYADNAREMGLITGGDTGVYNARRSDIENMVDRAVADARMGQSQAQNQAIRQGMRYGWSPAKLASALNSQGLSSAAQQASAANAARQQGIAGAKADLNNAYNMRNANQQVGIQGRQATRGMRIQDDATNWARKMDVAGLYRNLPGASQGAYGLSINSGNSAVANQMQPGNQLLSGMAQGAGTTMQGLGMQLNGLSSIMNNQASVYNASMQNQGSDMSGLGSLLGAGLKGAQLAGAFGSDRRLKDNIELVGKDERTGLNLYVFTYKDDPEQRRFRGVMADEVEKVMPEAVVYDESGFAMVNYGMLGIEMVEV